MFDGWEGMDRDALHSFYIVLGIDDEWVDKYIDCQIRFEDGRLKFAQHLEFISRSAERITTTHREQMAYNRDTLQREQMADGSQSGHLAKSCSGHWCLD